MADEPVHGPEVEQERRLSERANGGLAQREVRGRIDEQLIREIDAAVARCDRHERRERPAGRVTADRHARAVASDLVGVLGHPFRCGETVVDRSGRPVLWSQPIVDGDHQGARPVRQRAAGGVGGVEVPEDEPAAVEPHEHG